MSKLIVPGHKAKIRNLSFRHTAVLCECGWHLMLDGRYGDRRARWAHDEHKRQVRWAEESSAQSPTSSVDVVEIPG